jgi:hypothetical protein
MSEETLMDLYIIGLILCPRLLLLGQWVRGDLPELGVPDAVALVFFFIAPHALAGSIMHKNAPREEFFVLLLILIGAIELMGSVLATANHAF